MEEVNDELGMERATVEKRKRERSQTVVEHPFKSSTWEAEMGRSLSLRPAWSRE